MSADDLNAPLGQNPGKRRRPLPIKPSHALAGALALFLGVFVLWAAVGDDPFGGQPMVAVPIKTAPAAKASQAAPDIKTAGPGRYDGPVPDEKSDVTPPQTRTVTIIDGKTGDRHEVVIPAPANTSKDAPLAASTPGIAPKSEASAISAPPPSPADQKFSENTPEGPIPAIAADGVRPSDAFAQPVKAIPGKPDAPRIAIVVGGLGISETATANAIASLPGAVTLGFMPYGVDAAGLVARARAQGHEVLLQVPMEPFDYPNNDPGPRTLLTSLTAEQNIDRLYWLMSRFQGYVGITNAMGARFTASEQSFGPILREAAKRGLIYVDDGSNPRSVAGEVAGAINLPFARVEVAIDSVPTPTEIDHALARLEMVARERNVAVGFATALPVSIEHIAKWAKSLQSRGLLLVPITAVALKSRQS